MKSWPHVTNDSLFANKTFFPAFTAARVGSNPAAPTMAAITISTSGCALKSQIACLPATISVFRLKEANCTFSAAAADSSSNAANLGWKSKHCAAISSTFFPPTSAKIS